MTIGRIGDIESHVKGKMREAFDEIGAARDTPVLLQRPPRPEMGDFAVACFPLAKQLRMAPPKIAEKLAALVELDESLISATAEGGFLNLRLDPGTVARVTVRQACLEKAFGGGQAKEKLHYLVEFSSPNTNKPLHLGHVRNNTIGLSTCRILAHAGHQVTSVSLVNDRGIHICKTMLAYQRWADGSDPAQEGRKGDHFVGDLYVLFAQRFDEEYSAWLASDEGETRYQAWLEKREAAREKQKNQKPKKDKAKKPQDPRKVFRSSFEDDYFNTISPLGAATRTMLRNWEDEDEDVRALWARLNEWVYAGFDVSYKRLGVTFDRVDYESQTYQLGRKVVDDGLRRGLFTRLDDGAAVCDYKKLGIKPGKIPYKVLLRSDGTTVYTTQDLGTALARHDEIGFDRQVYIVGDEQKHHFEVLFALLALVKPELADACHHLAYGMVNLPEGKMKSREGRVVDADNLMDEMAGLTGAELTKRTSSGRAHSVEAGDTAEFARRAELIAQGAVKFYLLSFGAASTMTFDPQRSIDFLGRTGPYCMNAYARTCAIQRRAGYRPAVDIDVLKLLTSEREQGVVRALCAMPAEFERAAQTFDPSKIVDGTYDVARAFNQLYTDKDGHPIVSCEDARLRKARLLLTEAVGRALKMGLYLLGIDALEEM